MDVGPEAGLREASAIEAARTEMRRLAEGDAGVGGNG
jgi:hypothetical protein